MNSPLRIALGAFLITAAALKAAPALAEPAQATNVSVVGTADLNLATAAGRRALDHRLVVAAAEVCGVASAADLEGQRHVRQCRANTLAQARSRGAELAGRGARSTVLVASTR